MQMLKYIELESGHSDGPGAQEERMSGGRLSGAESLALSAAVLPTHALHRPARLR